MDFLCLDFEGVLIPEIWQYVAKETNSEELMLTTQDLKDYDELMKLRMKVVNEKNIKLSDIGSDMTEDSKQKAQEVVLPTVILRIASLAFFKRTL